MASPEGLEPPQIVLETIVLPLHQRDKIGVASEIRTHGFTVLQTVALGLSAIATLFGIAYGNRTRLVTLKG
jgi:hypothetical protein